MKNETEKDRHKEEQFQAILTGLTTNIKNYENKTLKYMQYAEQVDRIFSSYEGWSKASFYQELRNRSGVQSNNVRKLSSGKEDSKNKTNAKKTT